MVDPDRFVIRMVQHWQSLKNVPSPALEGIWRLVAATFNGQIETYGSPQGQRWKVLQPPTGTGKSQGLALYCSMIPESQHPGCLIVTRLITEANLLVKTINELAGRTCAVAYHSKNRLPVETLRDSPVLVITHRAYELGMDQVNRGFADHGNWGQFHAWADHGRKLIVIDEALDIVEESQINLDEVSNALGVIPHTIRQQFPEQIEALTGVANVLRLIADRPKGQQCVEDVLKQRDVPLPDEVDFTLLRHAMKRVRLDVLQGRDDLELNRHLTRRNDQILKHVHATLAQWRWYAKCMGTHTLNTARLIIPMEACGACILDATASSNLIYLLLDSRADIVPVPSQARYYGNVTLHVSKGHSVGKYSLKNRGDVEVPKLIGALNSDTTLGPDRSVFVVCHQKVEPLIVGHAPKFAKFDIGHWGAIDGRNDWEHYDTVVIFGLPYRPSVWAPNTFMAIRGVRDGAWLRASGNRPFKSFTDIRHALEVGQLTTSIVQAMNRVRCRRVIDAEGNCLPTDVYILLPNGREADEIIAGIKANMPGVRVIPWHYQHAKRKPRKSDHQQALAVYAANAMMPGRKALSVLRAELGIPPTCMDRIRETLKDAGSELTLQLAASGVRYELRAGGRPRAYLVKA